MLSSGFRCPRCGKMFVGHTSSSYFPFCSRQCKLVDLEGWFEDRYRISTAIKDSKIKMKGILKGVTLP